MLGLPHLLSALSLSEKGGNSIKESSQKMSTFFNLPNDIMANILLRNLDIYDTIIRAFPKWRGNPSVELEVLLRAIYYGVPTLKIINEIGYMALRLSASEPMDPNCPDIMKIKPSSILKWVRYLKCNLSELEGIDESGVHERVSCALFYFARFPYFADWYDLWTEDEKENYSHEMAFALLIAGKIDLAFELKCVNVCCKSKDSFGCDALLFVCLADDIQYFENVKDALSRHFTVRSFEILNASIMAKAKNILTEYLPHVRDSDENTTEVIMWSAIRSKDVNIFSLILPISLESNFTENLENLFMCPFICRSTEMISILLDRIELSDVSETSLVEFLTICIHEDSIAAFKLMLNWIYMNDKEMLLDIVNDLLHPALSTKMNNSLNIY